MINNSSGRRQILSGLLALLALPLSLPVFSRLRESASKPLKAIQQPDNPDPKSFMARAESMERLAVASGDQSFGAVIIKANRIVGESPSRVVVAGDPTAHAEMEAIRDASRRLESADLNGCIMYSTSPPCAMCETAAHWAAIYGLVHGSATADALPPRFRRC